MGEDKALLPFSSYTTLAQYQYERLKPYFKEIYLSSKVNKFDFLENKDENIIFDKARESSPLVALKSILEIKNLSKAFVITVDTPLVEINTISKIITNSNNYDITFPYTKKEHYLCGVYNKSCLYMINEMLNDNNHKIGFLVKNSKVNKLEFFDDNEFLNMNYKVDYLKAKQHIR